MSISSLASLCNQNSPSPYAFYQTSCFQAFVVGVEETLEERLTAIFAIATSRANADVTHALCDLAVDALLHVSKQKTTIASTILCKQQ
ncbi:hypothetical protein C7B61_05835 [filamentous cyanobacterium CCP1]|nr:hypothetical protein C7B76_05625 [filamentous cyanobacterium CCP2]PSB67506.1 hypothetical protein C7B61_05835 [filamentous cyanobacterium CCP1]